MMNGSRMWTMDDEEIEEYINTNIDERTFTQTQQDARDYELIWDDGDYDYEKEPEFWDHIRWLYGH